MNSEPPSANQAPRGLAHPNVIDLIAHDTHTDEVVLTMIEPRPWDGSQVQLFQLQEKINAYLSFALDGEMAEAYPALVDKPLRLRLECAQPPSAQVRGFLGLVREQVAFQGIAVEMRVAGGGCGDVVSVGRLK